ncbi:hypothetical protein Ciccas_003108 [Cichlidogyrus casuarinus]|uniref:Uncharacterized protein n=1 Tax=Cichlidogyrus casuarinus TaxID=1844966 RepID=A0ABD2QG04_9PLAT
MFSLNINASLSIYAAFAGRFGFWNIKNVFYAVIMLGLMHILFVEGVDSGSSGEYDNEYWKRMTFAAYILLGILLALTVLLCLSINVWGTRSKAKANRRQLRLEAVNCLNLESPNENGMRPEKGGARLAELQRKFHLAQEKVKFLPKDELDQRESIPKNSERFHD